MPSTGMLWHHFQPKALDDSCNCQAGCSVSCSVSREGHTSLLWQTHHMALMGICLKNHVSGGKRGREAGCCKGTGKCGILCVFRDVHSCTSICSSYMLNSVKCVLKYLLTLGLQKTWLRKQGKRNSEKEITKGRKT